MTGTQPLYTFLHFLDDPKLLNIVSNETWGMLKFSLFLKSIHLCQVSKSLLHQQIDKGCWGNNEMG